MLQQLDINSPEFKAELVKTEKFTDKVCESQGWVYSANEDVNEGVTLGLARHRLLFGKRFCPCFMVDPDESRPGKFKSSDDRICPCNTTYISYTLIHSMYDWSVRLRHKRFCRLAQSKIILHTREIAMYKIFYILD